MTRILRVAGQRSLQSLRTQANIAEERAERRTFLIMCEQYGLPAPIPQYAFAAPHKGWTVDYAWVEHRIILEVEGAIFSSGAHNRGRYPADVWKYNEAELAGWMVLRCIPKDKDRTGLAKNKHGIPTGTVNYRVFGLLSFSTLKMVRDAITLRERQRAGLDPLSREVR